MGPQRKIDCRSCHQISATFPLNRPMGWRHLGTQGNGRSPRTQICISVEVLSDCGCLML